MLATVESRDWLEQCVRGGLRTVFQPILDLRQGRIFGYEALSRGPAGSPLESPADLFAHAARHGRSDELELAAVRCAIDRYAALQLDAKLFVNFSPDVLARRSADPETLLEMLRRHGIAPTQLVIELTETGTVRDSSPAWRELLRCRAMGFGIAIDDLGEGFASLRLWSELRPEFVKIDKHFIQGVHADPIKLQMARAVQQIAYVAGATVVAEGIEEEADFQMVRDVGVRLGQGFLIGRPAANIDAIAVDDVWNRLSGGPLSVFPVPGSSVNRVTVRRLVRDVAPVSLQDTNDVVFRRFESDPDLDLLPVIQDGKPVGLVNRVALIDRFARPYRRELYGRRSCSVLMNAEPLIVDLDTSIQELSFLVAEKGSRAIFDGFVVTQNARYAGVGTAQDLIREMTELQIAAARYSNPLTQLPGNVPIAEHVERLIAQGCRFVACYFDLDNFKPYNDVFGYQRGDEAIQLTARMLAQGCDPRIDFVGHVGGDDFVVILQSPDWEERCRRMLQGFGERALSLFSAEEVERGGFIAEDRSGVRRSFPLLSISVGALPVEPGTFASHSEVATAASEAKRLAKHTPGNSLFIERRAYPVSSLRPPASAAH